PEARMGDPPRRLHVRGGTRGHSPRRPRRADATAPVASHFHLLVRGAVAVGRSGPAGRAGRGGPVTPKLADLRPARREAAPITAHANTNGVGGGGRSVNGSLSRP